MTLASDFIRDRFGDMSPRFAVVLGSSLGAVADSVRAATVIDYHDIPGFPRPSISGHQGRLVIGDVGGCHAIMLDGRVHYYETGNPSVMRPVIETFADLKIESLLLTNAAGSTRADVGPGRIMLITDHINFSGTNPLIGQPGDTGLVPMTEAYDPELANTLRIAAVDIGIDLAEGVYLCNAGPMFETPAEIRMATVIGADAVGMSTVPETILARQLGLRVAGLSAITNMAAGLMGGAPSHQETKTRGAGIVDDMVKLLHRFANRLATMPSR